MPLICFASPKGGVGKTTLCAAIAVLLRQQGHRVLALDCDPQNALRLHFGVPFDYEPGFMTGLAQGVGWREALVETASGVLLLPHGATDMRSALGLAQALDQAPALLTAPLQEMLADPALVVLADLPPGPSTALHLLAALAQTVLVILLADAASAALLPQLAAGSFFGRGTVAALRNARVQVVLNQVEAEDPLSTAVFDCADQTLGLGLVGAVARDRRIPRALAERQSLAAMPEESPALEDVRHLAGCLGAGLPAPRPAGAAEAGPCFQVAS
ncbi:cellulose biosynthesis protein BcsQ [Roseicella frigidaeris]|uniref:cellulose biosynthesis protein BcsQ n=1 Tax=Roseicella frigidaeris TaxID=2230885 RepID=UPI001403E7AE|nr:cellulose biosynthesis protein BcsQ [Roseicella frigidaeris]